ncbi:cobalamin biosynthesis protein CbiM [Planctomycetales bacterium]|nr:cobalamin biosynthesis protein CbiM [Planctomycetales bacterium]GHT00899.1 cobalamin biosynthesis protein CbiM [Planctomycetales bacterium]GHT08202.1 cobalamin biosynthesis protein CbiM [Planctomycetales bacterium]
MHMGDALLSPAVGGGMWVLSAAALGCAVKATGRDDKKVPMMSVLGAFIFAGQMINFTIPGTGSSGHIGGGILLAALLGAGPALLVLAVVLLIQCLFFADGGLLAYGANVFNMGVCACVGGYYLVYRPLLRRLSPKILTVAAIAAVVAGLQLGAFAVVAETYFSGVAELPFRSFLLLMQPIHLAIGVVEGCVTAAVLNYVYRVRPELLALAPAAAPAPRRNHRRWLLAWATATVVIAGGLSLLASEYPDGLEWAMGKVSGEQEIVRTDATHELAAATVAQTAIMPDYQFAGEKSPLATPTAGLLGVALSVGLAGGAGALLYRNKS